MTPAIRVENLSKQFRIGARQDGYMTLRESLTHAAAAPWRKLRGIMGPANGSNGATGDNGHASSPQPPASSPSSDTIWALNDVSFDVQPGEVIGIIGRNGAGKSTLLKVLSRITEPTSGRVLLQGRVASLLEVGTGFHPELTGRENIYLNGAILGMTRREIQRKFDEIVDFSEIETFLDTPVKRYSSGMYVRLAFAVASHLEPEILVVDEVLAVGDAAFQRKCLGKMDQVGHSGRTVLFVSHNMAAIQGLCRSAVVLAQGRVAENGDVATAIGAYFRSIQASTETEGHRFVLDGRGECQATGFQLREVRITSDGVLHRAGYSVGAPLEFHLDCFAEKPLREPIFGISVVKLGGGTITTFHTLRSGAKLPESVHGPFSVACAIDDLKLAPGDYAIRVGMKVGTSWALRLDEAAFLTILPTDYFGTGRNPDAGDGIVICNQNWTFESGHNSSILEYQEL